MAYSSATFCLRGWTVTVRGNHVYDRVTGPRHRVDIDFSEAGGGQAAARDLPHGLVGQSFSQISPPSPRWGRVDEYPAEGHVTTSAMAEGAIEGRASLYEVASAHATAFVFSRFDSEG